MDILLVDKGLAPTRERAQALILAAKVQVDGRIMTKAGQKISEDVETLAGLILELVRRGRLKERYALLWLATALFTLFLGVFPDNEILGNPANPLPCAVGHFDVSVAVGYEKAVVGRLE